MTTIIKGTYIVGPDLVSNGLVMHLDAANVKSYAPSATTWIDITNNNYNGALYSGITFNSDNKGSLYLNGTSYIEILNSESDFNLPVLTYSGWLKNTSGSLFWDRVMSKKLNYTDNNGYEISLATGTDSTLYIGGSSGTFGTITGINWINSGWHNLVIIFSGSTVSAYIDNSYKGQANIASIQPNSRTLKLGRIDGEIGLTQWRGNMAHIMIYNRALTASEISQNYYSLKSRFNKA